MSADDLWLIRERHGRFWPVRTDASAIVEGHFPDEPSWMRDPSFATWEGAVEYCNREPTEYGVFSDSYDDLAELHAQKAADQQAVRDAVEDAVRKETT